MSAGESVHLGFEVGSGRAVAVPIRHLCVTGQTQEAGKTTTLEALIGRADGLRAVAFVTKRGEQGFQRGHRIPPYFRERADWQFVASVLEATLRERLKFERAWIMRASKDARSLADVQRNVREAMKTAKGMSADVYLTLDEYLQIVIPQIERLPYRDRLELAEGINVMDLGGYTSELQALVIRSVLEWVYERERGVVVVVPEAWEFIPQRRGSPVKLAAEEFIRKGAGLRNYLWLDSQDLAGVDVAIRKSVVVWLLGVQREENEVRRTLAHIPARPKPTVEQVMTLRLGEFYACWGPDVIRVYVQPAWMMGEDAQRVAVGEDKLERLVPLYAGAQPEREDEDEMSAEERAEYERRIADAEKKAERAQAEAGRTASRAGELERQLETMREQGEAAAELQAALRKFLGRVDVSAAPTVDAVVAQVLARLPAGVGNGLGPIMVAAPAALRKEYQRREVERIMDEVRGMTPLMRDVLALLEPQEGTVPLTRICQRLGRSTGGNAWADFTRQMRAMATEGFVEIVPKHGARRRTREKITADLAHYQVEADEVEAVYAQVLAELAKTALGDGGRG